MGEATRVQCLVGCVMLGVETEAFCMPGMNFSPLNCISDYFCFQLIMFSGEDWGLLSLCCRLL